MMKNKIYNSMLYFIFLGMLNLLSCSKEKPLQDDELSLSRKAISGNSLKLAGYYYQVDSENFINPECFFYNTGHLIYIGGRYKENEIDAELAKRLSEKEYIDYAKNNKLSGGILEINGSSIRFEKWYPSSGGPAKAYVREGEILNDTTFVIRESYRIQKEKKIESRDKNETYHFKKFSPKPDSTNKFIH